MLRTVSRRRLPGEGTIPEERIQAGKELAEPAEIPFEGPTAWWLELEGLRLLQHEQSERRVTEP